MNIRHVFYQSVFWRILLFISSLVLNICIARVFQAESAGWFYYLITLLALIIQIGGLSLESGLGYFAAKKQMSFSQLARVSLAWALCIGVISLFIVNHFVSDQSAAVISRRWLLICSVCYISGNLILGYMTSFFYADLEFRAPNITGVATNTILIVYLLSISSDVQAGTVSRSFVIFFFVSFLLQAVIMMIFFKRKYQDGMHGLPNRREIVHLLRYTAMAYLSNLTFFFLYRVDYYFVKRYCTEGELGNYIQVSRVAHLFFILPGILAGVIFSLSVKEEKEMIHKLLLPMSRILFWLFLIICLPIAGIAKILFPFVFGSTFNAMHQPFLLLVPGIAVLCALYPLAAFYAGKDKILINIKGSLTALAIIITGNMLLVPEWGINGAALVSSTGYLTYYLYIFIALKMEFNLKTRDFLVLKKTDISLLSTINNKKATENGKRE